MPCRQYVACRVQVSVAGEIAGPAGENGLALARLRIQDPARRAPPARVRGVDLDHPAGCLVLPPVDQVAPRGRHDRAIQPGFGTDVGPRLVDGALGGPRHACDVEILDSSRNEAAGQTGAGLFHPVFAPVPLTRPQSGDRELDLASPVRAASGAGPVRPPHALARTGVWARRQTGACAATGAPAPPRLRAGRARTATRRSTARRMRPHPVHTDRLPYRKPSCRAALRHLGRRCVPAVPAPGRRRREAVTGHARKPIERHRQNRRSLVRDRSGLLPALKDRASTLQENW
jgi:hypothetical protein